MIVLSDRAVTFKNCSAYFYNGNFCFLFPGRALFILLQAEKDWVRGRLVLYTALLIIYFLPLLIRLFFHHFALLSGSAAVWLFACWRIYLKACCSTSIRAFVLFHSQPAWQAFEREGKGSFRCERNARSAPLRFPRAQTPLFLPFQTPATQAISLHKKIFVMSLLFRGVL